MQNTDTQCAADTSLTETECDEYRNAFGPPGLPAPGRTGVFSGYPSGCFVFEHHHTPPAIYFNTYEGGKENSFAKPICITGTVQCARG
eukprot:scaffold136589_cov112-Phaeocystis_antarctica.AAC.1